MTDDPLETQITERLVALIRSEIDANGGAIGFDRYMELALYAPGLGYYVNGSRKFGADGDFTTAPEISSLFSRCLARQCAQILEQLRSGIILEFGLVQGSWQQICCCNYNKCSSCLVNI